MKPLFHHIRDTPRRVADCNDRNVPSSDGGQAGSSYVGESLVDIGIRILSEPVCVGSGNGVCSAVESEFLLSVEISEHLWRMVKIVLTCPLTPTKPVLAGGVEVEVDEVVVDFEVVEVVVVVEVDLVVVVVVDFDVVLVVVVVDFVEVLEGARHWE